jgi:hypothetical protein
MYEKDGTNHVSMNLEIATASLNQGIDGNSLPHRRKCMNENEPRY